MFLAYDFRTGDLIGQVCYQAGETVVILSRNGYQAVGSDTVEIRKVN